MSIRKKTIAEIFGKFMMRYQRGNALCNIFLDVFKMTAYTGMIGVYFKQFLGFEVSPSIVLAFSPLLVVVFYLIGHWDEKKFGSWQFQNSYGYEELNPYIVGEFKAIKKLLEEITRSGDNKTN